VTRGVPSAGLLAVDIGNSRVKFGWYSFAAGYCEAARNAQSTQNQSATKGWSPQIASGLPLPDETWCGEDATEADPFRQEVLGRWLNTLPLKKSCCMIASVRRATTDQLQDFFHAQGYGNQFAELSELQYDGLPLEIHVQQPERVGIDRLLIAVAANRLRQPDRAAIVVDAGSAITVDLIARNGSFEGGAILPGPRISAQALQARTDALPHVLLDASGSVPTLPGRSTQAAIAAGLHWAMIGAASEIITQLEAPLDSKPELLVTGGHGIRLAQGLSTSGRHIRYRPNLVLDGIACLATA
jgi:type III pantothenate kinase